VSNKTGDKFMTGVVDTGDKSLNTNINENIHLNKNGYYLTIRALGEAHS